MADEKIDLDTFLEELVSVINKRLAEHERAIKNLEIELKSLKKIRQGRVKMDSSVLKVLRGK